MKKSILISISLLAACLAPVAQAAERSLNVLLTGGPEDNVIFVSLSQDGRSYLIDSLVPLEAPPGLCVHPEEAPNKLSCEAAPIASFEVNAGGGNDQVIIAPKVTVPATLRGGPGNDRLRGGSGPDKLIGGSGGDSLYGMGGEDWLFGGPGEDRLFGGLGDDRLNGGPDADLLHGGPGKNVEKIASGDYTGGPRPRPPAAG